MRPGECRCGAEFGYIEVHGFGIVLAACPGCRSLAHVRDRATEAYRVGQQLVERWGGELPSDTPPPPPDGRAGSWSCATHGPSCGCVGPDGRPS